MKKSLIALAVVGAFAPAAYAATSNVDIYGKLHMSVSAIDGQPSTVEDLQVTSNASRIGFKGSEDLGGGLKALWQIESTLALEEKGGGIADRNSFVGLSGNFGTVMIGNYDTPLKLVGRAVDLFGDTLADSRNVLGGGSDTRAANVIAYASPSFNGFQVTAAWANDLVTASASGGDASDSGAYNLSATYTNGPLYLGLGYGDGDYHDNYGLDAHWRAAAGYSFGDFRVVAQYDRLGANTSTNGDFDAWMIGGAYTMGPMVIKANYMEGEFDNITKELKQWTIGLDYNLSKRTSVYALYVNGEGGNSGTTSTYRLGGGAGSTDRIGAATAGDDVSAFSVGVVHNF